MIQVSAKPAYVALESDPAVHRYVFTYQIRICNQGTLGARLLTRHWIITNADGQVQEVHGEGVVGEQPYLAPGQAFTYTSGALLETPVGTMQGSYTFRADDGTLFEVPIPVFRLAAPNLMH